MLNNMLGMIDNNNLEGILNPDMMSKMKGMMNLKEQKSSKKAKKSKKTLKGPSSKIDFKKEEETPDQILEREINNFDINK
jgi:hypothetical protein